MAVAKSSNQQRPKPGRPGGSYYLWLWNGNPCRRAAPLTPALPAIPIPRQISPTMARYTIENTTNTPGTWWTTTDHTGNTGGYMMVVNASVSKTDYFYKREVDGLCSAPRTSSRPGLATSWRAGTSARPILPFQLKLLMALLFKVIATGTIALQTAGFEMDPVSI